ncbi:TAT-variant-translocated molybdopterin oxidoreductase [Marinoscillum furvescens]|uniref:Quinol:cytochrome c oxidoreductase iron-sulfur protein n=1 Tax=Marinoscillum furvescens DSM 4134 TaxID=1122208 RepID=A0A3D9L001_MARFU|nr:TAT-variant-translocated molybdopterin oxidoreductase [Marinoscillum furvescens]RED96227.1 quinol:cytochrome c oxidoreductase iron-sulfur protein precursor [Marinoscillum furvescens DSM 4134]
MKETKKYWKGLEQLKNSDEFQKHANKEFPEYLPIGGAEGEEPSRRDFLKLMGFGIAAVSLAACETPVKKAIPYVKKPVSVDPTMPNYYASTFVSGSDYCSVLVKTREGRPIKLEGNSLSTFSGGGTSSQVEASVLSLYDQERLQQPLIDGKKASWDEIDSAVSKELAAANGKVAIVTNSIASPATQASIDALVAAYGATHVAYDQSSFSGLLAAYESAFGTRMLPSHDFSKAKTIVSFGADFLGSWPNHTGNNKQFAQTRKLDSKKKEMSRLYAFESNLSLTGANADYRTPIKPSQEGLYVANLYNAVAAKLGGTKVKVAKVEDDVVLQKAANDLVSAKGASIVISGSNDSEVQKLVIAINQLLGSYGNTIDPSKSVNLRKGDDAAFAGFVKKLNSGAISGVIFYNCNPVYDHALGSQIAAGIKKAKFAVSTSDRSDETSSLVKYQAPDHHYLESWNDFEPVTGQFSLSQPAIKNIFDTRQAQESFLKWAGQEVSAYDHVRASWNKNVYEKSGELAGADGFWNKCLHDGVYELKGAALTVSGPDVDVTGAAAAISKKYKVNSTELELILYTNYSVGDGTQANNPWLQEMPDPITKATWDNYLTVSPKQAEEWGIELGDMSTQTVSFTANGVTEEIPVLPQPGQAYGTVGLAVGYGRTKAGKVANGVGVNAYQFASVANGSTSFAVTSGVSATPTGNGYQIAQTQTHQTYMGRETVIQETVLNKYQKDPQAGRHFPKIATSEGYKKPYAVSLWQGHEYNNHHWGMMIDLNSCTGCGSCTIACQTENNIPVVGKQEVLNRREMHWLRIDRYYSSDAEEGDLKAMEKAAQNPEVTFQPMMCQQCNNAPCETVCPVAATTHSSEGLNQMTYNRCIGTRYCANNCPYKVRRFNWFKYHDNKQFDKNMSMNNDLGKMVLNPDVTVRARGVMEKCSFCVQRIQSGKLSAKKEGRRPTDEDVNVACAASCPSEALVFGDMKNPESRISQMLQIKQNEKSVEAREPRAYHVLEELRVMPNVWYLTKVRNKDEESKTEKAEA